MIFRKLLLFLIGISAFILYSCNDNPASVGSSLLKNDYIAVGQIDSYNDSLKQTSSYYKRTIPLNTSSYLFLGRHANVQASMLLRFALFFDDSVLTDYSNNKVNITSATVNLVSDYFYGDSTAPFNFSVHKVNSIWTAKGFDTDSLSSLVYDPSNIESNINYTDSAASFNINLSVADNWMREIIDSTFSNDYGIYLLPSTDTKKVIGFDVFTASLTYSTSIKLVLQKPGVYTDTLIFYPLDYASVVSSTPPTGSSNDIFVQSSVEYNSKLWFDVSSIPKNTRINRAELILTVDSASTITGSSYVNSLYTYYLSDSTNNTIDSTKGSNLLSSVNNTFDGNITSFVQNWVNSNNNQGIVIQPGSLTGGMELFALKGSNAQDRSIRPRLIITYTTKK